MSAGEPIDLVEQALREKLAAVDAYASKAYDELRPILAADKNVDADAFIEQLRQVCQPTARVLCEAIEEHIAARRVFLDAKAKLDAARASTEEARRIYLEAHAKTENPGALVVPFPRGGRPS